MAADDFWVEGDYYHAFESNRLGISYKDLTDWKNLVWINLKKQRWYLLWQSKMRK